MNSSDVTESQQPFPKDGISRTQRLHLLPRLSTTFPSNSPATQELPQDNFQETLRIPNWTREEINDRLRWSYETSNFGAQSYGFSEARGAEVAMAFNVPSTDQVEQCVMDYMQEFDDESDIGFALRTTLDDEAKRRIYQWRQMRDLERTAVMEMREMRDREIRAQEIGVEGARDQMRDWETKDQEIREKEAKDRETTLEARVQISEMISAMIESLKNANLVVIVDEEIGDTVESIEDSKRNESTSGSTKSTSEVSSEAREVTEYVNDKSALPQPSNTRSDEASDVTYSPVPAYSGSVPYLGGLDGLDTESQRSKTALARRDVHDVFESMKSSNLFLCRP